MDSIRIETDGESVVYSFPSSYAEMDGNKLMAAASIILHPDDNESLRSFCGIPPRVFSRLSTYHIYALRNQLTFIRSDAANIAFKEWKLPALEIGGHTCHGPIGNFGNVTWGEFIYADQCMMQGLHDAAIAAMYRPQRNGYNHETDIRTPFTTYGTVHRYPHVQQMDDAVKLAIILNYRAMRRASLENAYYGLFPYASTDTQKEDDDDDMTDDTPEAVPQEDVPFSWTTVHRNLLGENIAQEDAILNLNVHTVLYRLNSAILENRKLKH